jgi:hypothetical protein
MAIARHDDAAVGLTEKIIAIGEDLIESARLLEDLWIGHYSGYRAQNERGDAELRISCDDPVKPRLADRMLDAVLAKSVDEHIDIGKDQLRRPTDSKSSMSCSEAASLRSIPGFKPPVDVLTLGITRLTF